MKQKKRILIVSLMAIALAGCGFLAAAKYASHKTGSVAAAAVDSSGKPIIQVNLYGDKASPNTLTVEAGRSVQFNSSDGKSHELAEGEGGIQGHTHDHEGDFSSGQFGAGEAWKVQFKKPGNYFFHDHLNPNVNILIVVYEPKA